MSIVLLWVFVFHGPHFWGTISRTFLDPTEQVERRGVLRRSLLWFLVGPLFVGAGYLVQELTGTRDVVLLFFFLAALWAYHHVVKQHFGFMALYRAKAREFDRGEFTFHKWYLILSLWAPCAIVLATSAYWLPQIPLVQTVYERFGGDGILFGTARLTEVATAVFVALQVLFVGSLAVRVLKGRGINLPETLIVLAAVPLHWVVVRAALEPSPEGGIAAYAFVPLVTIFHNVQYHGLVWHYNKRKYHGAEAAARYGAAAVVNRNLLVYFACGVAYTAVTIGVESYGIPGLNRETRIGELLVAGIWGFSFLHYYLDSKIWHVREDAALRAVLGLPDPPRKAPADLPSPLLAPMPAAGAVRPDSRA
jgi:hypothetical protein